MASPFRRRRRGGAPRSAEAVWTTAEESQPHFRPLYEWDQPIEKKILTIASEMYGAEAVDYTARAKRDRTQLEKLGFGNLPVCIAKTQQSLSDNPALLGRPEGLPRHGARESSSPRARDSSCRSPARSCACPACRRRPLAERFDLDDDGRIVVHEARGGRGGRARRRTSLARAGAREKPIRSASIIAGS